VILNFNASSGLVHLLWCPRQPKEGSPNRKHIHQFEVTSFGFPHNDDISSDITGHLIKDLLGDRAAMCCVVPLINELCAIEMHEIVYGTTALDEEPEDIHGDT